jgi:hypothetical protein
VAKGSPEQLREGAEVLAETAEILRAVPRAHHGAGGGRAWLICGRRSASPHRRAVAPSRWAAARTYKTTGGFGFDVDPNEPRRGHPAIRVAAKLAIDAGDLTRARALLDLLDVERRAAPVAILMPRKSPR